MHNGVGLHVHAVLSYPCRPAPPVRYMEKKSFRKLVQWIREEFEAAPDLRLTTREAAAFLGLEPGTCERVLSQFLRAGFSRKDPTAALVR